MRYPFNLHTLSAVVSFCLVLCHQGSAAQDYFSLEDSTNIYRLDYDAGVFLDSTNAASIDQIVEQDFQKRFRPSTGLNFGYTKSAVWLKVLTKSNSSITEWYLEIPAPFLEYVDFYQRQQDGSWQHAPTGYYRKQSVKKISHTGHVVPLIFDANSENTVFIKISGQSPKTFPLYVLEKEKFHEKTRREDIGYGIFYGILIVMFFYNLLLYLSLKEVNYLLYILTIVCTFVIFSSASGYAGKFLWPEAPHLNFYAGRMSMGVLAIFLAVFTARFLQVKRYSKVMYYALVSLIPLAIITNILVATSLVPSAGNNLISLATIIYMTTGVVCKVKGNKTANYFIAAWTIYLCGGLLLTLRNSGVLPFNFGQHTLLRSVPH